MLEDERGAPGFPEVPARDDRLHLADPSSRLALELRATLDPWPRCFSLGVVIRAYLSVGQACQAKFFQLPEFERNQMDSNLIGSLRTLRARSSTAATPSCCASHKESDTRSQLLNLENGLLSYCTTQRFQQPVCPQTISTCTTVSQVNSFKFSREETSSLIRSSGTAI